MNFCKLIVSKLPTCVKVLDPKCSEHCLDENGLGEVEANGSGLGEAADVVDLACFGRLVAGLLQDLDEGVAAAEGKQ